MIAWKQSCLGKFDSFLSDVAYFANSRRRQGIQLSRDGLKRDVSIVHLTMDNNSRPCDAVKGEFKSEVQRAREEEVGIELRHWLDWVYENKHSILPGDSVDAVPAYYSV